MSGPTASIDDTYFTKQPETSDEMERACNAVLICCVSALRYGGTDRSIIVRLGNDRKVCDHIINKHGILERAETSAFPWRLKRRRMLSFGLGRT